METRFSDEAFLDLLFQVVARFEQVAVRTYGNGAWYQFSGRDFVAHLGRACAQWERELSSVAFNSPQKAPTIVVLARASYNTLIASYSALLAGFDVLFLPTHSSFAEVKSQCGNSNVVAIATDLSSVPNEYKQLEKPVFKFSQSIWLAQDKHPEPKILSDYRQSKLNKKTSQSERRLGNYLFLSIGHDGEQILEELKPDALVLVAHHFILQVGVSQQTMWRSLELLSPSVPLAHIAMLAVLLKKGVIGFENTSADWTTNLKILRPSVLFAGPTEMNRLVEAISEVERKPGFKARIKMADKLEALQATVLTEKGLARIPEPLFNFGKRGLRKVSKIIIGRDLISEAVQDLVCVVHGLAPAYPSHVQQLSRLGVPVIETFGTTASGGMLSTNTFEAPHSNVLGNPLAHVSFRLGTHSTLEYCIDNALFEKSNTWLSTGDVVHMSTHGFTVVGRHKHLYLTSGGTTIAPLRIERLLKNDPTIAQACVVGDRLPYLAALLVLNTEAASEHRQNPEAVSERVQQIVSSVNENLPRNVTIKKFVILEKPFQETASELLATGEINRLKVAETRANEIAKLYL